MLTFLTFKLPQDVHYCWLRRELEPVNSQPGRALGHRRAFRIYNIRLASHQCLLHQLISHATEYIRFCLEIPSQSCSRSYTKTTMSQTLTELDAGRVRQLVGSDRVESHSINFMVGGTGSDPNVCQTSNNFKKSYTKSLQNVRFQISSNITPSVQ